jgi:hypothetical protein
MTRQGLGTRESPPNSSPVYLSAESQIPPGSPDRVFQRERGNGVQWGEFLINLPEASHVASTAPLSSHFGNHANFQTEAGSRFAYGGIERGEKVVVIGSRWQYLDILRGVEGLVQSLGSRGRRGSWRNRDLAVFEVNELQSELAVDNMPDGVRFAAFVERLCGPSGLNRRVRVWNSLGARFRESGLRGADLAIERVWHQARQYLGYSVLCSYPDSGRRSTTTRSGAEGLTECHTHLIRPTRDGASIERVPSRLRPEA